MSQRGVLYLAKELLSARANSFSNNKSRSIRLNLVAVGGVNLIAVVGGDTTAHEVRQRARCHKCGVKGNNMYPIVYTGNSGIAMDKGGVMFSCASLSIEYRSSFSNRMLHPLMTGW